MAKSLSKLLEGLGRLVRGLIGLALLVPLITLASAVLDHLAGVPAGARSLAGWIVIGAWCYLGIHLLFHKPVTLFRVHHGMLSRLAIGLFGGQVSTVSPKGGGKAKGKSRAGERASGEPSQGSTLLVLSPYLVPLYTLLVCVASWMSRRWMESGPTIQAATGLLLGASLTMHWVMTADDLQQDRGRFPLDAYLPALAIIGLVSLLVVSACLPLAVPGFSLPYTLADAFSQAKSVYAAVTQTLFF